MENKQNIRNFVIIAHIDHGKSTLADRLLQKTGTIPDRLLRPQFLDQLDLERERGITIKMAPVRMLYKEQIGTNRERIDTNTSEIIRDNSSNDSRVFILNLIDTPGHSDFSYEVSRALEAVEGAILLVDATQGIEAQTLATAESAKKAGLTIIGAINKIDIASDDQRESAIQELHEYLGIPREDILLVSGKTGEGVEELLEAVIKKIPPPRARMEKGELNMPNGGRALIFDSLFDDHKGIIAYVRVFDGEFKKDALVSFAASGETIKMKEIGYFAPKQTSCDVLHDGEIGYIATGIKDPGKVKIGDTVFTHEYKNIEQRDIQKYALPGYREPKPVVFVSFYPEEADYYEEFKKAFQKLRLTDSAITLDPDSSDVLGRGMKGGFLGRLHFEIAAERLEREFGIKTTHSFPSVAYRVKIKYQISNIKNKDENSIKDGWTTITNPKDFTSDYEEVEEPIAFIEILTPLEYMGAVLNLKEFFHFRELNTHPVGSKMKITAKLPLSDLIRDLDDKLKSVSQGFASLTYELSGWAKADVAKLEILLAGNSVPGLTRIVARDELDREGRRSVEQLKELLPLQQFSQAIQASSGGRIIARETIAAVRKDVANFGKNGGDRTRKMKLWKKQREGKVRLKERAVSSGVEIPASVFKELLKK